MHCPFCKYAETKVNDSRLVNNGSQVKRRRQCLACNSRFTTFENAELIMPKVIKRSEIRENFDEEKLRKGIIKALEKRPVSMNDIESEIHQIKSLLYEKGEREISSQFIGDLVVNSLKKLDKIAYVRFASVYFSFDDIEQFSKEIEKLRSIK